VAILYLASCSLCGHPLPGTDKEMVVEDSFCELTP
jgi:hypothetical protein